MSKSPIVTEITIPDNNGDAFSAEAIIVSSTTRSEVTIGLDHESVSIPIDRWWAVRESVDKLVSTMLLAQVAKEGEQ